MSFDSQQAAEQSAGGAQGGTAAQTANYENNVKELYQVGADDINKRGGIGGCPVILAWHDFHGSAADGWDSESQAECIDFAQDQHVFAVVPMTAETPVLVSCLARYHIPVLSGVATFPNQEKAYYSTGEIYAPGDIATDRLGPVIDMLNAAGYFGQSPKVGILIENDGQGVNQNLVNNIWKPRLDALHIPVVSTYAWPALNSDADLASVAQQMNNAVLQFRKDGVDHLLTTPDYGGIGLFLFTNAADAQQYHPRLGETTYNYPSNVSEEPAASLVGAMAISWAFKDVEHTTPPPPEPPNSAQDRCINLYKGPTAAAGTSLYTMFDWCDILNFLQASLKGAVGHPTATALQQGANLLGTGLQITDGFGPSRLGPDWYDGGSEARVIRWDSTANAWTNDTAPQQVP